MTIMNKVFIFIRLWALALIAVPVLGGSATACAQEKAQTDSTVTAIRLDQLKKRQVDLKKRIETEDKKRNRFIDGASVASLERMNLAQDSICLELRSELVRVRLEIGELAPNAVPARLLHQYGRLQPIWKAEPAETEPSSPQPDNEE